MKINSDRKNTNKFGVQLGLTAVIVFISRIPFLFAGYGVDTDGWRLATIARNIGESGIYGVTTAPGHPVQEYICSLFWRGGPLWLNGLSALMCTISVIFFALILKKVNFKNIILPSLAFAFTPVVYINSVAARDYFWALAFILAGIYLVMNSKPFAAGIMLALANGCRISSALLIIPMIIILLVVESPENKIKSIIKLGVTSVILTLILFIPVYLTYGSWIFFSFVPAHPALIYILYKLFFSSWGIIGFAGIGAACVIQIISVIKSHKKFLSSDSKFERYFDIAMFSGFILTIPVFLSLPHKAAYLIPAIPFTIILLGRYLNNGLYNFACVSIILSSFFIGVNRTDFDLQPDYSKYSVKLNIKGSETVFDFLYGPIIAENSKRVKQVAFADSILERGKQLNSKSVVITGEAIALIIVSLPGNVQGNVIYEDYLDSAKLKYYKQDGYSIYYMPGEDENNIRVYNINLIDNGGKEFFRK